MEYSKDFESKRTLYELVYSEYGFDTLFRKRIVIRDDERIGSDEFEVRSEKLARLLPSKSQQSSDENKDEMAETIVIPASP